MSVRKHTQFIFVTIVTCCFRIIACGVALGTDFWFHGSAGRDTGITVSLRYGLFKGRKTTISVSPVASTEQYDLRIICMEGLCMYSCGSTRSYREAEMRNARISGKWSNGVCIGDISGTDPIIKVKDSDFINFGLWLMTIIFLSFTMLFFALGGLLALYNSFRVPVQPIFSTFGLYLCNGLAGDSVLGALIVWGVLFGGTLSTNANVGETLNGSFARNTKGRLGFSYWILLLPEVLAITNVVILAVRSWLIAKAGKIVQRIDPTINSGDVLLF